MKELNKKLLAQAGVGNLKAVKKLLENGAFIDCKNNDYLTPITYAASKNHFDVVDFLYEEGANPYLYDKNYKNALDYIILRDQESLFDKFVSNDTRKLFDYSSSLITAGCYAYFTDEQTYIKYFDKLIKLGADVNTRASVSDINCGRTVLHAAANKGFYEVVNYLIDNGANVNIKDNSGYTALHLAISKNSIECAEILLKNNANVHAIDNKEGYSPILYCCVERDNEEMIDLLLKFGADINDQSAEKHTVLTYADEKLMPKLIALDADIYAIDGKGRNVLHNRMRYNFDSLEYLIKKGVDIDKQDFEGMTPIMIAVERQNFAAFNTLLQYDADISKINNFDATVNDLIRVRPNEAKQKFETILNAHHEQKCLENGIASTSLTTHHIEF